MDLHYSQTVIRGVWNAWVLQSPMDLHYSQTVVGWLLIDDSFNPLWIYTTLKHYFLHHWQTLGFNPLWIYTTLKLEHSMNEPVSSFNPL